MFRLLCIQRFIAGLVFATLTLLCVAAPASAYDRATVVNNTAVAISGTVYYAACRSDHFTIPAGQLGKNDVIAPAQTTMSTSRGACLITKVEATAGGVRVVPFSSSGTSRARFVIHRTTTGFEVFPG
jgi:hypothetical protein